MSENNINDNKLKENKKVTGTFYKYETVNTDVKIHLLNIRDDEKNLIKDFHWVDVRLASYLVGHLNVGDSIEFDAEIIDEPLYHLGKKIIKASNVRKVEK